MQGQTRRAAAICGLPGASLGTLYTLPPPPPPPLQTASLAALSPWFTATSAATASVGPGALSVPTKLVNTRPDLALSHAPTCGWPLLFGAGVAAEELDCE